MKNRKYKRVNYWQPDKFLWKHFLPFIFHFCLGTYPWLPVSLGRKYESTDGKSIIFISKSPINKEAIREHTNEPRWKCVGFLRPSHMPENSQNPLSAQWFQKWKQIEMWKRTRMGFPPPTHSERVVENHVWRKRNMFALQIYNRTPTRGRQTIDEKTVFHFIGVWSCTRHRRNFVWRLK